MHIPRPSLRWSKLHFKQVLKINSDIVHGSHFRKQQTGVNKEPAVFLLRIFSIWKMNGNSWLNFEIHLERQLFIVIS